MTHPWVIAALQALSVAIFLLVLLAAFFGDANPTRNFAPTFIWVIWWIGLAYLQALEQFPTKLNHADGAILAGR
jgi:hypothetical protein